MLVNESIISVIIPVYNVEPYLQKCIISIINQSMKEIEIILVDDGSTDKSGDICDKYARIDSRIKVIHQNNRGLSAARNEGLKIATGQYVMFVDSDDWVEPDYCKTPYELAQQNNADLVIFRFRVIGKKQRKWKIEPGRKSEKEAIRLVHSEASIVVWNKLFHRSLFTSIDFPVGKRFEDNAVTHRLIHLAKALYYSDAILYNKFNHEGNITSQKTISAVEELCEMRMIRYHDLQNWGYYDEAEYVKQQAMWSYLKSLGMKGEKSEEYKHILITTKHISPFLNWRLRLMIITLKISQRLFDKLCAFYGKRIII